MTGADAAQFASIENDACVLEVVSGTVKKQSA
jgi:hypothetical protein